MVDNLTDMVNIIKSLNTDFKNKIQGKCLQLRSRLHQCLRNGRSGNSIP